MVSPIQVGVILSAGGTTGVTEIVSCRLSWHEFSAYSTHTSVLARGVKVVIILPMLGKLSYQVKVPVPVPLKSDSAMVLPAQTGLGSTLNVGAAVVVILTAAVAIQPFSVYCM